MYISAYNTFTIQNYSKRLTLRAGFNFEKPIWEPCVGFSGMEARQSFLLNPALHP